MTAPKGSWVEEDTRYYLINDVKYPSVTSIIKKALPKEALNSWKVRQVIERAADLRKETATMNKANTIALLKKEDTSRRDSAQAAGSNVHAYIEAVVKGSPLPTLDENERQMSRMFEDFCKEYRPKFLGSEFTVFSKTYNYAGTQDLLMEINGVQYATDVKTGKAVYPEVALQLTAYDNAEWTTLGEEVLPRGRGMVLHVRPDRCEPVEVDIGGQVWETFLSLNDVFRWLTEYQYFVIKSKLPSDD